MRGKEKKDPLQDYKELANQSNPDVGKHNPNPLGVCPHCGYCPTCGRPYGHYPYYPPYFVTC